MMESPLINEWSHFESDWRERMNPEGAENREPRLLIPLPPVGPQTSQQDELMNCPKTDRARRCGVPGTFLR
jgi:hypothetical protein